MTEINPEKVSLGYMKDEPNENDLLWRQTMVPKAIALPSAYRRTALGPVLNQGQYPRCVAFSTASLKMHQEKKQHGKYYNFDPVWLYDLCKKNDGIPNEDGTFIRVALELVHKHGYLARKHKLKLKQDTPFKIANFIRLTSMQQMKEAIYTVGPVVFGITVDEGIYSPNAAGMVPAPQTDKQAGGHAMLAVGWDDKKKAFLVKNSWGRSYGLKGYIWLPYSHFDEYKGWDAWRTVDTSEDITLLTP